MKLSQEQSEANRKAILGAAERLFRERGLGGVGVAELMEAAGFTHGGFYNHFASKQDLAAEACGDALHRANASLAGQLQNGRGDPWRRYLEQYLSPAHRDDPAEGCTLSALAADAGREGAGVQRSFAQGLAEAVEVLAAHLGRGGALTKAAARAQALQTWSEAIGALVLARAVARADPTLSAEVLAANRRKLLPR